MSIKEACSLVLQSSVSNNINKTLFLDMGKPVKIIDVIKRMFKVYAKPNQKLKIEIVGNKFNEKITEQLFFKDKVYKTSIKKVLTYQDKFLNKNFFLEHLNKIISRIEFLNDNDLKMLLIKLLKIR